MNVFFIGIIRNSYLTLASLPFVSFVFDSPQLCFVIVKAFFCLFLGLWEVFPFFFFFLAAHRG